MDIEIIVKKDKKFVVHAPVLTSNDGSVIADMIDMIEGVNVNVRHFADWRVSIVGTIAKQKCRVEIEKLLDLLRPVEFEKYGATMRRVNELPQMWTATDRIPTKEGKLAFGLQNIDNLEEIEVLAPRLKVGDKVKIDTGLYNEVIEVSLIRLSDITNEDAERTGVEQIGENKWKHYCPEKLFPKDLLLEQEEGFPYMSDALGSYYSKWIKRYNVIDVAANPWVWRYEYKYLVP